MVATANLMSQDLEEVDHFLKGQDGVCSRVGLCDQSSLIRRCGAMCNGMGSTDRF